MRKVLITDMHEAKLVDGLIERQARLNGERVILTFSAVSAIKSIGSVQKVIHGRIIPWAERSDGKVKKVK